MTERETFTPEIIRENYPEATKIWQYEVPRALSWDELNSITEGTSVKIYTMNQEEYVLGHAPTTYVGLDETLEAKDPFPCAGIQVTRRPWDIETRESLEGFDITLRLVAKPSDEYSIPLDLWEADRERIEAAVELLGGERVI